MKKILLISLLFITVTLSAKNSAQFISQTVPESISPGQSYDITVTFKNTGTTIWTADNLYRLGTQAPQDNKLWIGTNRVALQNNIQPGQEITFSLTITSPTNEGMYTLQWRMVQDGVEWFGEQSEPVFYSILSSTSDSLLTEGNHFSVSSHVVSTTFFCWYGEGEWQLVSPWIPVNGRSSWDGSVEYWRTMIKQVMAANIDVLYVELIPAMDQSRGDFFFALKSLRLEGWNVPKICPFLDPEITYSLLGYHGNCATEEGKDELIGHYIRFYKQYYKANTDEFADDFIYTQDNHPVLNIWHIHLHIDNYTHLRRSDVTHRLRNEFGAEHPIFNNSIKMINNAISPHFSFTDERLYQFELQEYKIDKLWEGINSSALKPGYWDQNVRNPGFLLHRDGGSHYSTSWDEVNSDATINRVNIESFNEYDEGSGIYATKTDTVYRKVGDGMNNIGNDIWSSTNDPYEYIKTTAYGAAEFNDFKYNDAEIIWHNIPERMVVGETFMAQVIVRNTGNVSWNATMNYKFGENEVLDSITFGSTRYLIDDTQDEISEYGGIFRGRAKTFNLEITAPDTPGFYETNWGMLHEGFEWFGDTLTKTIEVVNATATNDIENKNAIVVYPNPVKLNNNIYFKGDFNNEDKISVYNVSGLVIYEKVLDSKRNIFNINLSKSVFSEGIYFVNIKGVNGSHSHKIIVRN